MYNSITFNNTPFYQSFLPSKQTWPCPTSSQQNSNKLTIVVVSVLMYPDNEVKVFKCRTFKCKQKHTNMYTLHDIGIVQ